MEVNRISNSPNFKAKIIVGDERINKFIKSSFMTNRKGTLKLLDNFDEFHPDQLVTLSISRIGKSDIQKEYLLAHNGITGKDSAVLLDNADRITPQNRNAFSVLVKRMLDNYCFWEKPFLNSKIGTTPKDVKIEHDVFKVEQIF